MIIWLKSIISTKTRTVFASFSLPHLQWWMEEWNSIRQIVEQGRSWNWGFKDSKAYCNYAWIRSRQQRKVIYLEKLQEFDCEYIRAHSQDSKELLTKLTRTPGQWPGMLLWTLWVIITLQWESALRSNYHFVVSLRAVFSLLVPSRVLPTPTTFKSVL